MAVGAGLYMYESSRKRMQQLKQVTSHVVWFLRKNNVKNVRIVSQAI